MIEKEILEKINRKNRLNHYELDKIINGEVGEIIEKSTEALSGRCRKGKIIFKAKERYFMLRFYVSTEGMVEYYPFVAEVKKVTKVIETTEWESI